MNPSKKDIEDDIKPCIIRTSLNKLSSHPSTSMHSSTNHVTNINGTNINQATTTNFIMSSPSKVILPSPTSDYIKLSEISTPTFRQVNINTLNPMISSPSTKLPSSSYELFPKYSLAPSKFSFETSPSIISSIAFVRNISSSNSVRSLGPCLSLVVADNNDSDEDITEIAIFKRHLNAEQREKRNYEAAFKNRLDSKKRVRPSKRPSLNRSISEASIKSIDVIKDSSISNITQDPYLPTHLASFPSISGVALSPYRSDLSFSSPSMQKSLSDSITISMSPSTRENMSFPHLQASPRRFDLSSSSPKFDDNLSFTHSSPLRIIESDCPSKPSIEAIVEKNLTWLTYRHKFNYDWDCSKYLFSSFYFQFRPWILPINLINILREVDPNINEHFNKKAANPSISKIKVSNVDSAPEIESKNLNCKKTKIILQLQYLDFLQRSKK